MNDHRDAAPKLPGVVRSVPLQKSKVRNRASSMLFACSAIMGVAGFFSPTLCVIAALVAWAALILKIAKGKVGTPLDIEVSRPTSMFDRELIPGSPDWHIRQIRQG